MPVLVNAVLAAIPKLADVVFLCGFVLVVLGIIGTGLFKGTLHYRCARQGYTYAMVPPSNTPRAEASLRLPAFGASANDFDTGIFCDPLVASTCAIAAAELGEEDGSSCMYFPNNPNDGTTSFDSFGATAIVLLQAITFDEWAMPMYAVMGATHTPLVVTFWLLAVLFGGFFLVNLFLAVLFQVFVEAQTVERAIAEQRTRKLEEAAMKRAKRQSSASTIQRVWLRHKGVGGVWMRMLRRLAEEQEKLLQEQRQRSDSMDEFGSGGDAIDAESLLDHTHVQSDDQGGKSDGILCGRGISDWGPPQPGTWRMALMEVMLSPLVGHLSTGLVLVNVALMCMPYYGMPESYANRIEAGATLITVAFIVEMALKVVSLGWAGYWSSGWNTLDGVIVIMSIVEMVLTAIFAGAGVNLSFLRMLRMLRVARMLRLMRAWQGLYKIVSTIIKALPQLRNVMILIILITTIFALLGMEFFGGKFTQEHGYVGYRSSGSFQGRHVDGALLGADATTSFESSVGYLDGADTRYEDEEAEVLQPLPRFHFDYFISAALTVFIVMTGDAWFTPMLDGISVAGPWAAAFYVTVVLIGTYLMMNLLVAVLLHLFAEKGDDEMGTGTGSAQGAATTTISPSADGSNVVPDPESDEVNRLRSIDGEDSACGCLPPDDVFRRRCRDLIESAEVDRMLMITVLVSSIALTVDTPRLEAQSIIGTLIPLFNFLFTAAFTFEAVVKSLAYGFICTPDAYLKSGWNILDFVLLLISLGALAVELFPQLAFLAPLRSLRVLRPLRILSRNKGMALVLSSLWDAIPAVVNVFGVLIALQVA